MSTPIAFRPAAKASTSVVPAPFFGLGGIAPKNTPAEIVEKLNKEINAGLVRSHDESAPRRALAALCLGARPPTSARLIAEETEKWGKVVKFSGAKVE